MQMLRKATTWWRQERTQLSTVPVVWYAGKAYIADPSYKMNLYDMKSAVQLLYGLPRDCPQVIVCTLVEIAFDGEVLGVRVGNYGLRLEAKDIIWLG